VPFKFLRFFLKYQVFQVKRAQLPGVHFIFQTIISKLNKYHVYLHFCFLHHFESYGVSISNFIVDISKTFYGCFFFKMLIIEDLAGSPLNFLSSKVYVHNI